MSKAKLLLSTAVMFAAFVGAAQASPYYPFASLESTGAPFERCWWEESASRPYRLCVPVAPHAWGYYGYGGYNPDHTPGD